MNDLGRNHSGKERIIRITSILLVGIVLPFVEPDINREEGHFWVVLMISVLRTAALWYGSEAIVEFVTNRFSILISSFRTLAMLFLGLTLLVLVVEFLEIRALIHLAKLTLTYETRFMFYFVSWLITFLITSIYAATFFFLQWHQNKLAAEIHERKSVEARYAVLRNQVNPHFLFNSFNTLSGMVESNGQASMYVQNLADFFRYILSVSDKDLVQLETELEFARSYAYLQEQRFQGKLRFSFDIPAEALKCSIPPLSLQMLLENAVKHNEISQEKNLLVSVSVPDPDWLLVRNPVQLKAFPYDSSGMGLENIKQRYTYLSEHPVRVQADLTFFEVYLPLIR
ncbi:MAG: histidine kinase [Bacteroidales bacterium]